MFHNLAIAIEYEVLFAQRRFVEADDREAFYWEHIAAPFARSHGCRC